MNKVSCNDAVDNALYTFIDVRSPAEFARGHINGACNIPLFSNQLRALVGIEYTHHGKQAAMKLAIEQVGPHLGDLVDGVRQIYTGKTLCVYCARGGMRSASVAQLYAFFGLPVCILTGGYKAFRNWTIEQLNQSRRIHILGGKTGAGKTEALAQLSHYGHQVVDLEALAQHRGSVFGGNLDSQATQQQFENDLALAWHQANANIPLWLEDESRKIGSVIIPESIWFCMQAAPVYCLEAPEQERIERIMATYGHLDETFVTKALVIIAQQLGSQTHAQALELLKLNDRFAGIKLMLAYYDKKYAYSLGKKQNVIQVSSVAQLIDLLKPTSCTH